MLRRARSSFASSSSKTILVLALATARARSHCVSAGENSSLQSWNSFHAGESGAEFWRYGDKRSLLPSKRFFVFCSSTSSALTHSLFLRRLLSLTLVSFLSSPTACSRSIVHYKSRYEQSSNRLN